MFKKLVTILLFFCSISIYAQISHGGRPSDIFSTESLQLIGEPNLIALKEETSTGNGPLRYAYPIYVDYSPSNSGNWYDQGDGTLVWQLVLKSQTAKSLSINFSQFKLSGDSKVFIYNNDRSVILGSFTEANNKQFGKLATSPVLGDEIVVELQTAQNIADEQQLVIGEVYHDFLGVNDYLKRNMDFGMSGDCNVDVSCDSRVPDEVRRSVVKYLVNGYLCSGTMVNNTHNDGTPYFLTAAHCVSTQSEAENMVFYFNFDSPSCIDSIAGTDQQQMSGAQFKSGVENMDFSLVELDAIPPASYRPYWIGWDINTGFSDAVYSVHHPEGDVKKVSWSGDAPKATTFNAYGFIPDAHWLIEDWVSGTTEGGSSGSGLFTQDGRIIGTLSGGYGSCSYPHEDYYARINKAWEMHSDSTEQLAYWLDPLQLNNTTIDGFDFYKGAIKRKSFANDEMSPVLLYGDSFSGSWSGTNSRGYDGFAQYFYDYSSVTIHGVYIISAICDYSISSSINVKIWNSIGGVPANVVFEISDLSLAEVKRREYFVELNSPLQINGEFFIGVELNNRQVLIPLHCITYKKTSVLLLAIEHISKIMDHGRDLMNYILRVKMELNWIDFIGSDFELATTVDSLEESKW